MLARLFLQLALCDLDVLRLFVTEVQDIDPLRAQALELGFLIFSPVLPACSPAFVAEHQIDDEIDQLEGNHKLSMPGDFLFGHPVDQISKLGHNFTAE